MKQTVTGGEYLARTLRAHGVTHLFQQEVSLRVTTRIGEMMGIQDVLAHSEAAAAYMADGYARATGRIGVCSAQSIGAANLSAGLADAYFAGSPVVAFTGKKPQDLMERNAYQELNHLDIFRATTKYNVECVLPSQLPHLLRQAIRSGMAGKPGPVHLDLQGLTGEQTEMAQVEDSMAIDEEFCGYPPFRPMADGEMVEMAASAIDLASRPILVAGRGVLISAGKDQILEMAIKCDIPVATTPDGKTSMDEKDPLWAGIVGAYGMPGTNQAMQASDLVIFVGTQASDQTTNNWTTPNPETKVIQIDISPYELGRNYPASTKLHGDVKTVLNQLISKLPQKRRPEWRKQVAACLKETLSTQLNRMKSDTTPIQPDRLCHELSRAMPDDAILVSDTGYSAIWTSTMVRMKPTQTYLRAAGTLGWGFPASLGVKLGQPDRPVFCFTGDGGFYYHLAEMETAVRYKIHTVTILNNNGMLLQDAPTMKYTYPENPQQGIDKITFTPVDFSRIAREFGMFAIRVEHPEEIGVALKEASQAEGPVLIEVITDQQSPGPLPPNPGEDAIGEK